MTDKELLLLADEARAKAYSPYSDISVGAALLAKSGKVYLGANIENSAHSPTICAERVAFSRAIFEGERDFLAIAISGGERGKTGRDVFSPCGVCRQVMSEFCRKDFKIILAKGGKPLSMTLGELLPLAFGL